MTSREEMALRILESALRYDAIDVSMTPKQIVQTVVAITDELMWELDHPTPRPGFPPDASGVR